MISCRTQIKDALLTICDNVKMERPEGKLTLPLLTYAEITNAMIDKRQARIDFQVDIYESTFAGLIQMTRAVDDVMTGLGWFRTYVTPDANARVGAGLYHKATNYTARIDTLRLDIIGGN